MTITAAILQAALPKPCTVCGVRLRPVSIGHWILLNRFEISNVTGEPPSLPDLLLGILICSSDFVSISEEIWETEKLTKVLQAWQYHLSGGLIGRIRRKVKRILGKKIGPTELLGFDFIKENEKFQNYLDSAIVKTKESEDSFPLILRKLDPEPHEINSPDMALYLLALVSELGFSLKDAMDIHIPFARYLLAINGERKGHLTILDRQEKEESQRLADEFYAIVMEKYNGKLA